jgi:hypothetical protein
MFGGPRLAPAIRLYGSAALLYLVTGCQPGTPLGRAGVTLEPPAPWRPVAATTWPVPGTPLAAWAGPHGSSLVAYRALPIPDGTPQSVVEGLVNRLSNLPGLTVVARRTEPRGGTTAARVEAVAPGTGDTLAPSGIGTPVAPEGKSLVPTHRIVVAFPGPADTICLVWHAPESARDELESQAEATLQRLRIDPRRLDTSSYGR